MRTFAVDDLSTTDRYKLMTGLVVPRPIGWIGTSDADGIANLAPYSFFQAVATNPPVVLYSVGVVASPHMAPKSVTVIEAMPMTATGKIQRKVLRDRFI